MALRHQTPDNTGSEERAENTQQRAQAPGGGNGNGGNGGGFGSYRNEAPGSIPQENPLYRLLRMQREVTVPAHLNEFLQKVRDTIKNEGSKSIKDFDVYQCDNPRSVFMFQGTDKSGRKVGIAVCFMELIGSELPRNSVKSVALEDAHMTMAQEFPDVQLIGYRMVTKLDVETRPDAIIKDIINSLKLTTDTEIMGIEMSALMKGNPQFVTQTRNLEEVRRFFDAHSPSATLPAMNAGMTISLKQTSRQAQQQGFRQEEYYTTDTIVAVAVMIDFVALRGQSNRLRGRNNDPQYAPRVRITGIEAIAPLPGFVFWGLVFAIEKFAYQDAWTDAFYNGNELAGDPANLFPNPEDAKEIFSINPEDADLFWRDYADLFGAPIVTLDVEFGRKNIPFLYNFAAAAEGNVGAIDDIIDVATAFFGGDRQFRSDLLRNGNVVANMFESSHTGIVSQKNRHFDSRDVTYLSAMAGIVGSAPDSEIGLMLLNPGAVSADQRDQFIRDWLGETAFTPIWDTKTVLLRPEFTDALTSGVVAMGMSVQDNDQGGRSRMLFQGRGNMEGFGYTGTGARVYSTPSVGGMRQSSWTSYSNYQ